MEIVRFGRGSICLTLKGFCQQINGEIFAFWHFSVTNDVSFNKNNLHKLAPSIKNTFLAFFMEFSFLAFKKYLT